MIRNQDQRHRNEAVVLALGYVLTISLRTSSIIDSQSKSERRAPEHCGYRSRHEHFLQARTTQIRHHNQSSRGHAQQNGNIPARSSQRVEIEQKNPAVPDGEEISVLHEDHRHVGDIKKTHVHEPSNHGVPPFTTGSLTGRH
jgi:hypothetical protein